MTDADRLPGLLGPGGARGVPGPGEPVAEPRRRAPRPRPDDRRRRAGRHAASPKRRACWPSCRTGSTMSSPAPRRCGRGGRPGRARRSRGSPRKPGGRSRHDPASAIDVPGRRRPGADRRWTRDVGALRTALEDRAEPLMVRSEIPRICSTIGGARGARRAGRQPLRERRRPAVAHHRGAEPAARAPPRSRRGSPGDRDGAHRRDHGALPVAPDPRHAGPTFDRTIPSRRDCATRWSRSRSGSSGCSIRCCPTRT